jgi:hypothetical protein
MPQLDIVCDLRISFNINSSWMSWTLDVEFISAVLVKSDFITIWDQCHWNVYLVLFTSICRTSKYDFVCVLYINLKPSWS